MKAAIVIRVSTEQQSYQRQLQELTTIANRDGYTNKNTEIFGEVISGYKLNQGESKVEELMTKINSNPKYFNIIYVSELSRLGRNPSELRKILDRLDELQIPVFIQSLGQSTSSRDSKGNYRRNGILQIVLQVLMEFSHIEAETFKARSKSGIRASVAAGKAGGSNCLPYGYTKDEQGMLVVDKEESKVINHIFALYQQGMGSQQIAQLLNAKGILTRLNKTHAGKELKYKISKTGDKIGWSDVVVLNIISNPLYKGERRLKGEIFKAPAVITPELWDECNTIRLTKTHRNYETKHTYLLKDIIKCGVCGRNMVGKYKPIQGGDCVYKCASYLGLGKGCGNTGININFIESVIYDQFLKSENLLGQHQQPADWKYKIKKEIGMLEEKILIANKAIEKANIKKNRVLNMYVEGIITSTQQLKEMQSEIEDSILGSKAKLKDYQAELKSLDKQLKGKQPTSPKLVQKLKGDRKGLSELFNQWIDKIIVNSLNHSYSLAAVWFKYHGKVNPKGVLFLLDKRALKNRYGGELKYYPFKPVKHNIDYSDNVLMTQVEYLIDDVIQQVRPVVLEIIKIG